MIRKFRVWDKRRKEFRTDIYVDCIGQIFQSSKFTPFGKTIIFINDENIEISQSTGLFDKNRVEIYEGDILKASSFANWIGEVRYSAETQAYMFFDTWGEHKKRDVFLNQFDQLEVIGNIYENKELLGDDENFE